MTESLDLPANFLALVREILARHAPHAEVWAYGSRIHGSNHGGSDLDLVVRNGNAAALREAFSESDLPILVDVLEWAKLPADFRDEIERAHVIVQEA